MAGRFDGTTIIVDLSERDISIVFELIRRRYGETISKKARPMIDKLDTLLSYDFYYLLCVVSEVACARALGAKPEAQSYFLSTDKIIDLKLADGTRVACRPTDRNNGCVLLAQERAVLGDYLIACEVGPTVRMVGWIPKNDANKNIARSLYGKQPARRISLDIFRPMADWWQRKAISIETKEHWTEIKKRAKIIEDKRNLKIFILPDGTMWRAIPKYRMAWRVIEMPSDGSIPYPF